MKPILCLGLGLIIVGACSSSDPFDPGSGDSAGSGTGTLVVQGAVSAQPRVAAAMTPADFDSEFAVEVALGGVPVTSGTVTMTSKSGKVALVFEPGQNTDAGAWRGQAATYDEVYQLDVASGTDRVTGVRVDGPDIHWFTAPTVGATVDATQALPLTWDRGEAADVAALRDGDGGGGGGGGNGLVIPDSGTYSLAPGSLHSEKDKAQPNTLRLQRTNRVTPAGAAAGSELDVSVTNTVDVVAQPNPNA